MENMDKGLTVPKWVLMNRWKIPQMPQNLFAKFVCPSLNIWDFDEKRLHRASVVRALCGRIPWESLFLCHKCTKSKQHRPQKGMCSVY